LGGEAGFATFFTTLAAGFAADLGFGAGFAVDWGAGLAGAFLTGLAGAFGAGFFFAGMTREVGGEADIKASCRKAAK
jgi:hypothetical protein